MRITVLGITGYTGSTLLSILAQHPEVRHIIPVSQSCPNQPLEHILPQTGKLIYQKLSLTDGKSISAQQAYNIACDVVFSCLPHTLSAPACLPYLDHCPVIDLSADFRFQKNSHYEQAYQHTAFSAPCAHAYGLAEWYRDKIRIAQLIAIPGCYATACLIPLLPLVQHDLITSSVVIHAMSGISGAGKSMQEHLMFCERTESARAYLPGRQHRHYSEINEKLSLAHPKKHHPRIVFNPHLIPMRSGILTSITVTLRDSASEAIKLINERYHDELFVRIWEDLFPETSWVTGSNRIDIGLHAENNMLFISTAIDNLIKGAAGHAVQNMNILFKITEHTGLRF